MSDNSLRVVIVGGQMTERLWRMSSDLSCIGASRHRPTLWGSVDAAEPILRSCAVQIGHDRCLRASANS